MQLNNQVAFVTGATGGIGSEICRSLAKEGANISICYHKKYEEAQVLYKEIISLGRKALLVQADVSKKEQVISAFEATRKKLGPIDILVNNAGVTLTGKLEEISEKDWDHCLAVNLKGVFLSREKGGRDLRLFIGDSGVYLSMFSIFLESFNNFGKCIIPLPCRHSFFRMH